MDTAGKRETTGIGTLDPRGRPFSPIVALAGAPVVFSWLYPVTGLAALLAFYLCTYVFSHAGSWMIAPGLFAWCESPSALSLFPMLFDKYRTCAATGSHGTFAFNPTAAWTAAITVAIVALAGFGRFEATLTRSRGYIIARHAWRCAVPACVALFFLQTMHLTNVVTAAGQMVLALAVVALCHCLFQFGRHATTRNPPASAVVYLVGGVSSALLVLGAVGSELVPRAYRSLPSHSMGAAMVAPGGPNMVPRTAPKRLRNGKSRNSYESADGSGLGESGDVGSGFGSEEVQAVGIAVPAAAPKEANPGSTQ